MSSPETAQSGVSHGWRRTALGLAGLVVLSWAFLGYTVLDGIVSLDYCRAEGDHLKHDIAVLAEAAKGRLSSGAFLAARAQLDPDLPQRLEQDNTLPLKSIALQFGADALLKGVVVGGRE